MKNMFFYALPFETGGIHPQKLSEISDVIEELSSNGDCFVVPLEFYNFVDHNGKTFYEALYRLDRDSVNLMIKLFVNVTNCDDSYSTIKNKSLIGFISDGTNVIEVDESLLVKDIDSLINVYRFQSVFFGNYDELFSWHNRCFPSLCFTKDSFNGISVLGDYSSAIEELMNCLSALNDFGIDLFRNKGEEEAIKELQSITSTPCTGKGRKEDHGFVKDVGYIDYKQELVKTSISCIPHFKLEKKYSDKRMHFSWGTDKIHCHKIIVVHIGKHWDQKINSSYSEIE